MRTELDGTSKGRFPDLGFTLKFDPKEVHLTPTPYGMVVRMDDFLGTAEPGAPDLPTKLLHVALPQGTRVKDLVLDVGGSETLEKDPLRVAPVQEPRAGAKGGGQEPKGDAPQVKDPKASWLRSQRPMEEGEGRELFPLAPLTLPKPELYERAVKSPRPWATLVAEETHGPVTVAVVRIDPVRMDKNGGLILVKSLSVRLVLEAGDAVDDTEGSKVLRAVRTKALRSRAQAVRLRDMLQVVVINPELIWDFPVYFPDLHTPADYVIITDDRNWDAGTIRALGDAGPLEAAFQRLADWKNKRGVRTKVVTITEILSGGYGNFRSGARDLQEVIRNFLKWAYDDWGIAYALLGGDVGIVPVRSVSANCRGHIPVETNNPPANNRSFWTGSFLKMHVVNPGDWWPGPAAEHVLVTEGTGELIPRDPTGTGTGWHYCTSDTYATVSATPTEFVRVNGTAALLNATLKWQYHWNTLPTDLYYASLEGPGYNVPGRHDWDVLNNGLYGQHDGGTNFDGVNYATHISVGRASVTNAAQATAFVDKVIAYEQFRTPAGALLDASWPGRLMLLSSNWGGRIHFWNTPDDPPGANRFHALADRTVLHLETAAADMLWNLLTVISSSDIRLIPYDRTASPARRGWYFAKSGTDHSVSEWTFSLFGMDWHFPIPSGWIVVYANAAERAPQYFILDRDEADGSMSDQEQLREQIGADFPLVQTVARCYEDQVDLTPAQRTAAPVQDLSESAVRTGLNAGPHFVSLSGHGNSNGCCDLGVSMARTLTNGYHSFIGYADSCLTNEFDSTEACSEALIRNANGGAVAYVGNTRFSWIGLGDDFQRAFFRRLTTTAHLGHAQDSRFIQFATNASWDFYQWIVFTSNLMGDPEMPVWRGTARHLIVDHALALDKRDPFTVHVSRRFIFGTLPLAGAVVHLQQGTRSWQATTDLAGNATFNISNGHLGTVDITVSRIGYIPYMGAARITGPAWVDGTVTRIVHRVNNEPRTSVQLHLDQPIDGDADRSWNARPSVGDYGIILDACTDAYVTGKSISLYVDNTDEGGTIERFAFNRFRLPGIAPVLDLTDLTEMG